MKLPNENHFWSKVERNVDGCWPWTASLPHGYGQVGVGASGQQRMFRASRLAYFFANGRWPTPIVRHTCDNPACCRPSHLIEGTQQDNVRDMVERGRQQRHERHAKAKLNWAQVFEIRALHSEGVSYGKLAQMYNVHLQNIAAICQERTWRC